MEGTVNDGCLPGLEVGGIAFMRYDAYSPRNQLLATAVNLAAFSSTPDAQPFHVSG